jgi:DNA-binding LacI/PurR family transcriptional regulator
MSRRINMNNQRPANVTIDVIAKSAGVSRATVSRVLNGSAKVSPQVAKAVKKSIAKHNYIPNATARRLAGGRSGLTVLLLEETNEEFFLNPFWSQIVQGFSAKITEAGMHPILLIHPKSANEETLFTTLRASKFDGIAIFSWHRPLKSLEKVVDPKSAIVFGGDLGGSKNYSYVDVDNVKGGRLATDHLIEVGCKNIVTITGDLRLQSARDRLEGYEKSLMKSGMKIDERLVFHGDYTQYKAEELTRALLKAKIKFDGIFAANDQSAIGAINVLTQNKIPVPEKVKIVGFDDSPIAARNNPSLTTVKQPIHELGAEVATSLLDIIGGLEVHNKTLDVQLIKRKSTSHRSN